MKTHNVGNDRLAHYTAMRLERITAAFKIQPEHTGHKPGHKYNTACITQNPQKGDA